MKTNSIIAYGIILIIFLIGFISIVNSMTNNKLLKKSLTTVKPTITQITNKPIKTTSTPIKKDKIDKNTMAYKAYKKLRSDNMLNENYIVAMYVLQEIDENVRTVNIEESLFNIYHQTFEFSDESKIRLSKKLKDNGDFRFIPYATNIVKDK